MFRAGGSNGWISSGGVIADSNRDGLHRLVSELTRRIHEDPGPFVPNTGIPSGYTYLLQFIAHDMVDSVASFGIDGGQLCSRPSNARSVPLMLDTLYGSGPDQSPQAYAYRAQQQELGRAPRTHLRLGPGAGPAPPGNRYCPFHDIARSKPPDPLHEGSLFTEAMLADPRNDAHALLSQLTVLFQRLHNHILSLVEKGTSSISSTPRELAYRRFRCARLVVTMIYRNVIEKDVLCRILDDRIYRHYVTNGNVPCDSAESIPLEFSFGAFRFGHSMVRENYNVNSRHESQPVSGALLRSSQQQPALLPDMARWFIDWDRFFPEGATATADRPFVPNFSTMIGPRYLGALHTGQVRSPGLDDKGLAWRDLLSACYAGVLSVAALCSALRAMGFDMVKDFAWWREQLETWLPLPRANLFSASDDDTKRIVEDPPLPFFVLFEAERCGGGKHLGPVGSIIVAETVLGAIKRHPLGLEQYATLQERISRCGESFFDESSARTPVSMALSQISEIETMPQLLEYMGRQGCFA